MKQAALSAVTQNPDPMFWHFDAAPPPPPRPEQVPARHVRFHTSFDRSIKLQIWEFWGQVACKTWQREREGVLREGSALLDDHGVWWVSDALPRIGDVRDEKGRVIGSALELPLPDGGVVYRRIRKP